MMSTPFSSNDSSSHTITIDTEQLRKYLIDYFGSGIFVGFPTFIVGISEIENMSPQELIELAENIDVDLERFAV